VKYELIEVQEHGISVVSPQVTDDEVDFSINWAFDLDVDIPEDGKIAIKVDARIVILQPENQPDAGHFSATHIFTAMTEAKELADPEAKDKMFNFLATLVGISLGTMRGLAFARTVNVFGSALFMPVVNPSELLKMNWDIVTNKLGKRNALEKSPSER
jgi:hypothetical protein